MTEHFATIAILVTIIGIVVAVAVKLWLSSKKEIKSDGFDKGKLESDIEHFKEKFNDLNLKLNNFEEDIQQGRIEHDSIQKQFADIRDRVGKLEGMVKGRK